MSQTTLTPTLFENAIWEGHVTADTEPRIEAHYLGEVLNGVELTPNGDGWTLRIPVPVTALSDGVHTVVIRDVNADQKLGDFAIIAGVPATDDLRAEVALLRAELDMLKRAVRRANTPRG